MKYRTIAIGLALAGVLVWLNLSGEDPPSLSQLPPSPSQPLSRSGSRGPSEPAIPKIAADSAKAAILSQLRTEDKPLSVHEMSIHALHAQARSTRARSVEDLSNPVWQEMIAGLMDWQSVFEKDWECRDRHESSEGSVFGCVFEKVVVVERVAQGLGKITRSVAVTNLDPVRDAACIQYAQCHADLWTGTVFAMPDNAKSPSIWSERVMIPPKGVFPESIAEVDQRIEEQKEGLAYYQRSAETSPELGYKVLFFEDLIGTMELYKMRLLAQEPR